MNDPAYISQKEIETIVNEGIGYMSSIIQAAEMRGANDVLLAKAFYHLHEMHAQIIEALEATRER